MSGEEVAILQSIRQKPPCNDSREKKNIAGACVPDGTIELPYFLLPEKKKKSYLIKPLYLGFYYI